LFLFNENFSFISTVTIQNELDKRKQEYATNLIERKQRLANLYNTEMENWRNEVLSKVETQEDRKAR
jgi:hypothetical protein